ncbi:multidrug MFS transporter [Clostridia bacterium]|nr:multidrug MFS transporter [Clostridia bacterium]
MAEQRQPLYEGAVALQPQLESLDVLSESLTGNQSKIYLSVKRLFDIVGSILALITFSPIFLVTAIAIKIEDPKSTVFFKQQRTGQHGVSFDFWKFRSMIANADALKDSLRKYNEMSGPVFKITNDPRVTKVGRFIRKTSIDELPQMINVLRGEMSFIGPRPLPVKEEMGCTPYQRQREVVVPGISCLWQISGRNKIDFDGWIDLDLKYIREQSLFGDLAILIKTPAAVLRRDGAA